MSTKIALLATGSELIQGEILNTNGQYIAQALKAEGIQVGTHVVCDDGLDVLTKSMQFLLEDHDTLITIGGLGPTSDDCTRFALEKTIDTQLVFSDDSWHRICDRLTSLGLKVPESNRQQAYFPKEAEIYANPNGTADGCHIEYQGKHIFMLPGPPRECRPMFNQSVMKKLQNLGVSKAYKHYLWRLIGISEAKLGEEIDRILQNTSAIIAYRADYPYMDVKLSIDPNENNDLVQAISIFVTPYFITNKPTAISKQLRHLIPKLNRPIAILDRATEGMLSAQVIHPENKNTLSFVTQFSAEHMNVYRVKVEGLARYWSGQLDDIHDEIKVTLSYQGEVVEKTLPILIRGKATLRYATERISSVIYQFLQPYT